MTPLDRLKELQQEMDTLRQQATEEAMTKVQEALEVLNALGNEFVLTQKKRMGRPPKKQEDDIL